MLNASKIGFHISDVCINHVFYADDLYLIAPCVIALQDVLTIGYRYSVEVNPCPEYMEVFFKDIF